MYKSTHLLPSRILRVLAYYDIFEYPLLPVELYEFVQTEEVSKTFFEQTVTELLKDGQLFQLDEFLALSNTTDWAKKRRKGNALAAQYMEKARSMSGLIASFPFIKGVFLSGSISKNYMDEDGDIDYFVVTETGRLWITRSLLKMFRLLFLFNSSKYFCINYFVDEAHLLVDNQNIFIATEVITVIPTFNYELYKGFLVENDWVRHYYPMYPFKKDTHCVEAQYSGVKKILEKIFNSSLFDKLEVILKRITVKHWRKKFAHLAKKEIEDSFKSTEGVSRQHANNYQEKVLKAFTARIKALETQHNIDLSK